MRRIGLIVVIFSFFASIPIYAQFTSESISPETTIFDSSITMNEAPASNLSDRVLLALSSKSYLLTPGDVITLRFQSGLSQELISATVLDDYSANFGLFGTVSVKEQTLSDFRVQFEKKIALEYPDSMPQVSLASTGLFSVLCTGEVKLVKEYIAWGLTRLSDVFTSTRTEYASERSIIIRSYSGSETVYDLYRAQRYGDMSQNPYLRPGDTIILSRYAKLVKITGAVRRPGVYQILNGEFLEQLVEQYADGLLESANRERINIEKHSVASSAIGKTSILSYDTSKKLSLDHMDSVYIPSVMDLQPVCWFEGAIGRTSDGASLQTSNRIPYTFIPGARLSIAVSTLRDKFTESSNLSDAYVQRGTDRIFINIDSLLYDYNFSEDLELMPGDRIVIPFSQLFVTVSGAVMNPGRYPYIPDRSWDYYINLAGGFNSEKNTGSAIDIRDIYGRHYKKDRIIAPEDMIVAKTNSSLYYFSRFSSILTTVLSVGTLTITILEYFQAP